MFISKQYFKREWHKKFTNNGNKENKFFKQHKLKNKANKLDI